MGTIIAVYGPKWPISVLDAFQVMRRQHPGLEGFCNPHGQKEDERGSESGMDLGKSLPNSKTTRERFPIGVRPSRILERAYKIIYGTNKPALGY